MLCWWSIAVRTLKLRFLNQCRLFLLALFAFRFHSKTTHLKKKVFFQHSAENINDSCLFYNFLECLKLKQCSTNKNNGNKCYSSRQRRGNMVNDCWATLPHGRL